MELNEQNYFSLENAVKYQSVSQIKSFLKCEAAALAEVKGEYQRPKTDALLIGSLVDVLLTGTEAEIQAFYENHPEMVSSRGATKGQLKQTYAHAIKMANRAKQDELFMKTLKGKHQVIMTGEIGGVPIKIKVDALGDKYITDLKTCENMHKTYYKDGNRVSFIENFDYITQGAIYREIVKQNTNKLLPFYLSCVSKESEPDLGIINIDNQTLDEKLSELREIVPMIQLIKDGTVEPTRCEKCEYCRMTKKLESPISWQNLAIE